MTANISRGSCLYSTTDSNDFLKKKKKKEKEKGKKETKMVSVQNA